MAIRRRSIATALVALVLIGGAAALWWKPAKQQPRFARGGEDGPVPVIAALTRRSDVPVYLDGAPIHRSLSALLVDELVRSGFTDPARVYIQSFELANLIELRTRLLPAAGIDARLMQLYGDTDAVHAENESFALPYDLIPSKDKEFDPCA